MCHTLAPMAASAGAVVPGLTDANIGIIIHFGLLPLLIFCNPAAVLYSIIITNSVPAIRIVKKKGAKAIARAVVRALEAISSFAGAVIGNAGGDFSSLAD